MILVKTPLRITLFGGGSDYPTYFKKNGGRTLGLSIDKYCYIAVNKSPIFSEKKFFVGYSKVEKVNKVNLIKHPSVKACLKYMSLENERIQIHYFADLPAKTGLGSSSAFTVSLLKALYKFKKKKISNIELAKKAIEVEQLIIRENVGCQDQITTSVGGLLDISYFLNNKFKIKKNFISKKKISNLCSNLVLYYSGIDRFASDVLKNQVKNIEKGKNDLILKQMVNFCQKAILILKKNKKFEQIGKMLNENWEMKKKLSKNVTNKKLDNIYKIALKNGAIGGKIIGAGSGGFFMFYVPKEKMRNFVKKMTFLKQVKFKPVYEGSRFI